MSSSGGIRPGGGGSGDFVGPASSTDGAVVVFDGVTGKLGKDSSVKVVGDNLQVPTSAAFNNPSLRIGEINTGLANDGERLRAVIAGVERVRITPDRCEFMGGIKSMVPWAQKGDIAEASIGPDVTDLDTGIGSSGANKLALVAGNTLIALAALVATNGYFLMRAHDGAIADVDLPVSFCACYLNEAGNALVFKVKYAAGTVKTGSIALT